MRTAFLALFVAFPLFAADLAPDVRDVQTIPGPEQVAQPFLGKAFGTLTQGMSVYFDKQNQVWRADSALTSGGDMAIVLNSSFDGQPVALQRAGDIDLGCNLVPNMVYVVSATTGRICPITDLRSGQYVKVLGFAKTARAFRIAPVNHGVMP